MNKNTEIAATTAARWTANKGGDRVAQDYAAMVANLCCWSGRSTATAIEKGYQSGILMMTAHNNLRSQS